ncbi:hypothetical protein [Geobacter anodireducens]
MSHHIVEVRDLCHCYPDGTEALRGISFRIHHASRWRWWGRTGRGNPLCCCT